MLKAGDRDGAEMLGIVTALDIGGLFKAVVSVVGVFKGRVEVAFSTFKTASPPGSEAS